MQLEDAISLTLMRGWKTHWYAVSSKMNQAAHDLARTGAQVARKIKYDGGQGRKTIYVEVTLNELALHQCGVRCDTKMTSLAQLFPEATVQVSTVEQF